MTLRRLLLLLLICLIPLQSVLAGSAMQQTAPTHEIQMSQSVSGDTTHDCGTTSQTDHHALKIGSGCDAGKCISHCAISLPNAGGIDPVQIAFIHSPASIARLSSIALAPPSRPPSQQ